MSIVEVARTFVGKREKPKNSGFEDPELEKKMIAAGWKAPWPYCILGVKMCALEAEPMRKDEFNRLFDPNCQRTFDNFKNAGFKITMTPEPGTIVIWSQWVDGVLQTTGHGGVVTEKTAAGFGTIEFNTDGPGTRDGDGIHTKSRVIVRTVPEKGKVLIVEGFIHLNKN